jgi:hypothetical protein
MIRIWAEFTALQGEYLALDFEGSFRDIRRQKVEVREGLHIVLYDDTYQSEAIVEKVKGVASTAHSRNWATRERILHLLLMRNEC